MMLIEKIRPNFRKNHETRRGKMKNFVMMVAGICMMLWSNSAKADLPPAPEQCTSQSECFAILGNGNLYIDRKGVEKGVITLPSSGVGKVQEGEGYIVATWVQDTIVWVYHLATGTSCTRDLQTSCSGEMVVYGQEVFIGCPELVGLVRMPVDCSTHYLHQGGTWDYAASLTRGSSSNSEIYVTENQYNQIGYFEADNMGASVSYPTSISNLGFVRYNDPTASVYFNGNDGQWGIFYRVAPLTTTPPHQVLVYVPDEITHMSINDTHIFGSTNFSYGFLVDIANQSFSILNINSCGANAMSNDTLYVYSPDSQAKVRAFDMQGNEKTSFSPLPLVAYSIVYLNPTIPGQCQNSLVEVGEVCDGTDFDGETCESRGYGGGELACNLSCSAISEINCWYCGDGIKNDGEECDGNEFGAATCSDYGYTSGALVCNSNCEIETTGCYTCGDGFIEGAEQCEGNDLNGGTCENTGFVSGTLSCNNCMYDTSGCSSCGDNIINATDLCDGSHIVEACQTLGMGFSGGTLACNSTCDDYDTSGCTKCGNGVLETGEECDLSNLDGATCDNLGFGTGAVTCYANCTYNVQGCSNPPQETCGNNVVDPGEQCDDGNRSIGDGCDEECQLEPDQSNCSNNIIEADEQCDGTDLGGISCNSLGFLSGAIYCRSNCTIDAASCNYGSYQNTSLNIEPSANPDSGSFNDTQINAYNEITDSRTLLCQASVDGEDLLFTTSAEGYCPVEIKYGVDNKAQIGTVFAMIYKPENALNDANPVMRIKPDGALSFEGGANMRAHLWAYPEISLNNIVTESAEDNISLREEFVSVNPRNGNSGRFVVVAMGSGLNRYCSIQEPEKCAIIVGGTEEVLDLDNLEESLGQIGRSPKSGCSIAGGPSGNKEIPVFLVVTLLFLAVRIQRRK